MYSWEMLLKYRLDISVLIPVYCEQGDGGMGWNAGGWGVMQLDSVGLDVAECGWMGPEFHSATVFWSLLYSAHFGCRSHGVLHHLCSQRMGP